MKLFQILCELHLKSGWLIGLHVYKAHISLINLCVVTVSCLLESGYSTSDFSKGIWDVKVADIF